MKKSNVFFSIAVLFIFITVITAVLAISERNHVYMLIALSVAVVAVVFYVIAENLSVYQEIKRYNKHINKHVKL